MRPRGRRDSFNAAVGDLTGALRRRRSLREPFVRIHDDDGSVRSLVLDSPEAEALIDAAEAMLDATATRAESRK